MTDSAASPSVHELEPNELLAAAYLREDLDQDQDDDEPPDEPHDAPVSRPEARSA